jgi:hypothetical protein
MKIKSSVMTVALAGVSWMNGATAFAQSAADEDLALFRKDVRSLKKQIIAATMELTDKEAEEFWPIYDRYTAELITITDAKYAPLGQYAQNYDSITDEQAENYIKGRAAVEDSIMKLSLKYLPVFLQVLSGRSTALFFQMDWRLSLIIDLQLASQTPLIEP